MSNPPTHLIIVCCHAIYLRGREGGSANEAHWLIEPFQAGETGTYIKHIEAGVKALAEDTEDAILVFSGGATKRERTGVSEAEGYLVSHFTHRILERSSLSVRRYVGVVTGMMNWPWAKREEYCD